ncbi:MAG TPA: phosphoenolpyruvate carboxylase, partial [Longimicrobium sp.]|nr:phosphoenolpyruvate carboxylase [Longimicrobium sp.]
MPDPLWSVPDQARRLAELTANAAPLKDEPLRRDVRSLGMLLGQVIREQEGDALYAAVEELRGLSITHRGNDDTDAPEADASDDEQMARAERIVEGMEVRRAYRLTQAFSTYFELANLAETAHRKRRRRASRLHAEQAPQPGTFEGTLLRLRQEGLDREAVLACLA